MLYEKGLEQRHVVNNLKPHDQSHASVLGYRREGMEDESKDRSPVAVAHLMLQKPSTAFAVKLGTCSQHCHGRLMYERQENVTIPEIFQSESEDSEEVDKQSESEHLFSFLCLSA